MSSIPLSQVVYKEEPELEQYEPKKEEKKRVHERTPVREKGEDISLPRNPRQVNDVDW